MGKQVFNTLEQMMQHRADTWSQFWCKGGHRLESNIATLLEMREGLLLEPGPQPLDPTRFKALLSKYPDSTGTGTDAWDPRSWKELRGEPL